jgi:hypothetical protein
LIYLPVYTSHLTQPLDVGVFSPLKRYFTSELSRYKLIVQGQPAQKRCFIQIYMEARKKAFSKQNIESSFRATGIYPFNKNRIVPIPDPPSSQTLATSPSPSTESSFDLSSLSPRK